MKARTAARCRVTAAPTVPVPTKVTRTTVLALPALLTLMTLLPGATWAQFASGNYEIYGRVNLTAYNISGYRAGQPALNRINSVGSRLGVRFEKPFNEWFSGTFRIEGGVTADAGTGDIASREVSAGLKGPWGAARGGYMLTPLDDLHSFAGPGYLTSVTNDNFSGFWANGYTNMFSNGGASGCTQVAGNGANNSFGFDGRYGNSLRYDSPDVGGFSASTHLSLGETKKADGCSPYAWSSKIQYAKGPLKAAVAYNRHQHIRGAELTDNILMLAANYQLSAMFNLGAYWQTVRYANPVLRELRQDGFGFRARALVGKSTYELGWYRAGKGRGDQTPTFSGISIGEKTQANLYILGYRYAIDKAMDLWVQAAILKNGSQSSYDLGGGGVAGTPATLGASPRTLAVGIKYDF